MSERQRYPAEQTAWTDPATGIKCEASRHTSLGHWCGYVILEPGTLTEKQAENLQVHGGVTYNETRAGVQKIGFDCAHIGDIVPGASLGRSDIDGETFKDLAFVRAECERMARQIKDGAA